MRKKRDTSWAQKEERPKREGETEEDLEKRFYGSRLGFQCGLARQFQDPKTQGNSDSLKYVAIKQAFIRCQHCLFTIPQQTILSADFAYIQRLFSKLNSF